MGFGIHPREIHRRPIITATGNGSLKLEVEAKDQFSYRVSLVHIKAVGGRMSEGAETQFKCESAYRIYTVHIQAVRNPPIAIFPRKVISMIAV